MGDQINLHLEVKGKSKDKAFQMPLTLEKVSQWIRLQEFDEYTTNGLIALASRTPTAALWQFRKNFNLMVNRVRAKRRKELGGIENVPTEGVAEEFVEEKLDIIESQKTVQVKEEFGQDHVEEV
jgi:hypothetical protein